jgi:NTP pyrophosphatase (non-canonical NTP hydrolase)
MTTPPTFPEYKGPQPRPPANPLIAVHEIGEHASTIAHLDLRETDAKWSLSFDADTQPLIAALMQCPDSDSWITPFEVHLSANSLAPIKWTAPTVAPNGSPLVLVEKLRGRALRYREELNESPLKPKIVKRLDQIEDCCDAIHFALRRHPDAKRWQHELTAYERAKHAPEQNSRDCKRFTSLVEAIAARQREWDRNGRLTPLYHALELGGEIGELLNCVKKQERLRLGLPGSTATDAQLHEELADVLICTHLLANALGIDVEAEARKKFNSRSEQLNFGTRVVEV